jgi:anti-anti-sigma factor
VARYDAELSILEEEERGFGVLACVGSLVEGTSARLLEAARRNLTPAAGPRALALGLSGVAYMSSVGIGALLELDGLAREHGVRLSLFGAKPEIQRLFRLTALDERIAHFTTREEALGYLALPPEADAER